MVISGNKITGGDMFPALNYPFNDPIVSTTTAIGVIFLVAISIELNPRSNDTTLNQKIFEWGDLGLIINDGSVGNNIFVDGTSQK